MIAEFFSNQKNVELVLAIVKPLLMVVILLQVVPVMVWVERRGSALIQNRLGPNRIFPLGLLYSLADAVKFIFKEDHLPKGVSKFYFLLAPAVSAIPAFMTCAVVPFAAPLVINGVSYPVQLANLNIGLLYVFSIASLGVYGIIMAGWASNNKYALLGSIRSSSQMISYELSQGLSVVGMLMIAGSMELGPVVEAQAAPLFTFAGLTIPKVGFLVQPMAFLIFITAMYAETNRLPFDLPEGESEIVAGYHLEYGSMKFALFMLAEYLNMTVASMLITTLFFGGYLGLGWALPHITEVLHLPEQFHGIALTLLQVSSFVLKTGFFLWLFVWVRWTLPRFRYDQLMDLGWKVMLPLALVNIFITGVLIYYRVI